ncbi:uncharacterized protein [Dysidea avara]|uniref:uncharacterized protein n=1 Tax=Dysidea avara TaxID=196820 RepID=UPI0033340C99
MAAIDGRVSPTYGNVALNNEEGISTTAFSPLHGNQATQPPVYYPQATGTKYPSVAYHPHNSEEKQVVITTQPRARNVQLIQKQRSDVVPGNANLMICCLCTFSCLLCFCCWPLAITSCCLSGYAWFATTRNEDPRPLMYGALCIITCCLLIVVPPFVAGIVYVMTQGLYISGNI